MLRRAYWMLTALTTITYFIPYLGEFPAFWRVYVRLSRIRQEVLKFRARFLMAIYPRWAFFHCLAVALLFRLQIDMGGYFQYAGEIIGGAVHGCRGVHLPSSGAET